MAALRLRWAAVPSVGKLAVALLGLGLIGAAGLVIVIAPARTRTAALEARRAALVSEIPQARKAVDKLARDRRASAELEQQLEVVMQRLPAQREIPALYRSLNEAATSAGLAVALFQPREARSQDYYW